MLLKASAPGSLMLLGEYAVLHGQHALVCAIDKRMTVTLSPRPDKKISLESALGQYETTLADLKIISPFQFVLAALKAVKKNLTQGCDIKIESEFSATVGFASSAAVTVATLSVLSEWLHLSLSKIELIKLARRVVRHVQGTGSGADVAACVMGGIVLFRMKPLLVEKLSFLHPITVIYSGMKTPTVDAIARVKQYFAKHPQLFHHLCQAINRCTLESVAAIRQQDWQTVGRVMNIQQGLMSSLGVNTLVMNEIVEMLYQQPSILGAKISGSGFGDCVVALGELSEPKANQLLVSMTSEGVYCEKN